MTTPFNERRRLPLPSVTDGLDTHTSRVQAETEEVLLNHIPDIPGAVPTLQDTAHKQFLARNLIQGFPTRYQAYDASQPWLMYWTMQAFAALQVGMDPDNKKKIITTIMAWQHSEGGFGGGPGQFAHLLPTYAAVSALAIVGQPGEGGGWDQIDRTKMYSFFMSLKQPDGSFLVTHHGEVDVRGIYCLLCVAIMLDIVTPELVEGTAGFIASCQTYEGGFSSSSQPYFAPISTPEERLKVLRAPRPPLGEAHGGYTFCALASWVMLQPFIKADPSPDPPSINRRTLLRWLTHMQGSEIELGGFRGRTNKLVDGCYAWWVGGAFGLLGAMEAAGIRPTGSAESVVPEDDGHDDRWADDDGSLFDRRALQEYILWAGQHPSGGLRDKPPKSADSYHTLYCLSGLSSAQHRIYPSRDRQAQIEEAWSSSASANRLPDALRKAVFAETLCWTEDESATLYVGGKGNRLNATHPVFGLTMTHTEAIMSHFYKQAVPARSRTTTY